MDPVSLTLAAIPIATQLLGSCLTGYDIFCRMSTVGEDAQVLQCKLQIEHTRLRLWANDLQADGADFDEQLEERGIKNLVVLILAHLCTTFTDTERLRKHYGLLAPQGNQPLNPTTSAPSLPSFLALFGGRSQTVADSAEAIKTYAETTQKTLSLLEKWKFALKDKKKFAGMLEQLRYYNDSLISFMLPSHRARLDLTLSSRILDSTVDPVELGRIRAASQESAMPLSSTAIMKRFRLLIRSPETAYISASELRLSRQLLSLDDELSHRSLGKYGEPESRRHVIAEWKDYDSNLPPEVSLDRIQDIARYLHANSSCRSADLPVLECLGYIEEVEHSRCCFLYSVPKDVQRITTLESLIPQKFDPAKTPNLEDRLQLARILAAAVFRLHITGWLHKGIRSSNIMFLSPPKDDLTNVIHPTLMGFDYSRPDRPNEKSDQSPSRRAEVDLYVHPEYERIGSPNLLRVQATYAAKSSETRYKKVYDIYSLGIVFIEVALWQPVGSFYKRSYSLSKFRKVLLDIVDTELGHVVGAKYRNVVKSCLEWEAAAAKVPASAEGHMDPFLTLVVNPLYECP